MKKQNKQKPLSNMEIAGFCNQMSMMLRSGISSVEGIGLLLEDAQTDSERDLLQIMSDKINETSIFYDAVLATDTFPSYMLNMVKLGEETGTLDEVLQGLAEHYTKEENLAGMIRSALVFPCIMLGMMFLIIIVLLTKVMPVFNQVFQQLGQEMTGFSAGLLTIGETLSHYSILFLLLTAVIAVVLFWQRKRLPFQRKIQEEIAACRFADAMSIALKSGMTPEQGLDFVVTLIENDTFQEKLSLCRSKLDEEIDFSDALHQSQIFTGSYARMAYIAGKSGIMDETLAQISTEYEQSVNTRITSFIAILEPTLVIILSLIVGVILFSVMLPLVGIMAGL